MPTIESNATALLVAVPMIVILFAGLFRLDELLAVPPKKSRQGAKLSGWDEDGRLICADPDGRQFDVPRKSS